MDRPSPYRINTSEFFEQIFLDGRYQQPRVRPRILERLFEQQGCRLFWGFDGLRGISKAIAFIAVSIRFLVMLRTEKAHLGTGQFMQNRGMPIQMLYHHSGI